MGQPQVQPQLVQVGVSPLQMRQLLLRILAKRIIVNVSDEIVDHELHLPFVYLTSLSSDAQGWQREACGLSKV